MHPPAQQKDLADQFTTTARHTINQGQISKILSYNFDYLDGAHTQKDIQELKGKSRTCTGDQPALDGALFEWQQRIELKKAIITGDILKEKAKQLQEALPQYDDIEMPEQSNGQLEGFKT